MMVPKQDVIVICKKCDLTVPINQTTYDNSGRDLICFECYNKIAKGQEPEKYNTVQSADYPVRVHYKCTQCHFTFSRSEEFTFNGLCFNCGKSSVEVDGKKIEIKDRKNLLDY